MLLVRVTRDEGDRWVAFIFGPGRDLLERDWLERGFGLRVCLNLAYPRGEALEGPTLPPRLKTINANTIEEVSDETRRRASRSVPLENFGIDVRRDLMAGVAAYPVDSREWGKVVQGATPFRHSTALEFDELGDRARRLVEVWSGDDFRDRFSFVEHIRPIDDERVNVLESIVLHLLASDDHGGFDLVPPEDLGSEAVAAFKLPEEAGTSYNPELTLAEYLRYVGNTRLDIERLIDDRIRAVDSRGQVLGTAPVFDFVTGQVVFDGRTYVLSEGLFYEVDEEFLNELTAGMRAGICDGLQEPFQRCGRNPRSPRDRLCHHRRLARASLSAEPPVLLSGQPPPASRGFPGHGVPCGLCLRPSRRGQTRRRGGDSTGQENGRALTRADGYSQRGSGLGILAPRGVLEVGPPVGRHRDLHPRRWTTTKASSLGR